MNSPANDISDRAVVYVVADNGVNGRIRALGKLRCANLEIVYVTRVNVNVAPLQNLVIEPYLNPFGILRWLRMHRLKDAIDSMFYFPTRNRLYVAPVVSSLKKLIANDLKQQRRVVVLTCAPPHALCLVGKKLKKDFPQIRWVIDWQDLWSYDESYFNQVFRLYRGRARRLEKALMFECDMNVTTNRFAKEAIEALCHVDPHKVSVINHHFDAVEHCPVAELREPLQALQTRRIVFMGGMFKPPKVSGGKFLEALKTARAAGINVELHLYGSQGYEFERFRGREREYGFAFHGSIPHAQVHGELQKYDYQLLLLENLPNSKLIMHLKLPEYLRAEVPIIAIVPRGSAVEDIVQRTGTGHVIASDSDWAQGLGALLGAPSVPMIVRDEEEIALFEWRNVERHWRRALDLPQVQLSPRVNDAAESGANGAPLRALP